MRTQALDQFVKETAIKGKHLWIMIDTGININDVPDPDIFVKMDETANIALNKGLRIHLLIDAKRIDPLKFDIKKFTRIQKYFAEKYNPHVDKIFIINANAVFRGIQNLITPFLDSTFAGKITYPASK